MTKKTVAEMFNRWPNYFGSKQGACDVVVTFKDRTHIHYKSNGCHGIMYNVYGADIDRVYSSLWCRDEGLYEAACEYWNYLLDSEISPFKLALPNLERLYDDKGRPLAFGLLNQGVPNQYCVPLMMQCRVPQENTNKLRAFKEFRQEGFDLVESFFLSEHYYFINGDFYKVNSSYEHAFSPSSGIDFTRLKTCTPDPSQMYPGNTWMKDRHVYTPVTSMWQTPDRRPSKVWALLDTTPTYTGFFPSYFKKEISAELKFPKSTETALNRQHVIDTLKANRTGW